eukprot:1156632-Pelagomonas_calceolata.AAC.15
MQLSQFSQTTCLLHGGPRHLPSPLPRRPGLLGRSSLCCNKHVAQGYREEGSASLGPEGVPFAKDGAAAKRYFTHEQGILRDHAGWHASFGWPCPWVFVLELTARDWQSFLFMDPYF